MNASWGGTGRPRVPRPPGDLGGIGSDQPFARELKSPRPPVPPDFSQNRDGRREASNRQQQKRSRLTTLGVPFRIPRLTWIGTSVAMSVLLLAVGIMAVVLADGETDGVNRVVNVATTVDVSPNVTGVETTAPTVTVVTVPIADGSVWEEVARSVVLVEAQGSACGWIGSGSIVGDGSYVLTNQHVSGDGECELSVWLTDSTSAAPTRQLQAEVIFADADRDLAVIRMINTAGVPFVDPTRPPMHLSSGLPRLGDKITILGYPGLGGSTITLTSGDFSGVDTSEQYDYLKTTANMNPGVSGGAALNSAGELVGIPTAGRGAEIECGSRSDCVANGSTIGLLRPVNLAREVLARAFG